MMVKLRHGLTFLKLICMALNDEKKQFFKDIKHL
jgi:hypothetical protein